MRECECISIYIDKTVLIKWNSRRYLPPNKKMTGRQLLVFLWNPKARQNFLARGRRIRLPCRKDRTTLRFPKISQNNFGRVYFLLQKWRYVVRSTWHASNPNILRTADDGCVGNFNPPAGDATTSFHNKKLFGTRPSRRTLLRSTCRYYYCCYCHCFIIVAF